MILKTEVGSPERIEEAVNWILHQTLLGIKDEFDEGTYPDEFRQIAQKTALRTVNEFLF